MIPIDSTDNIYYCLLLEMKNGKYV